MRVGIDLDGVCYDFSASLREYLLNAHPDPDPDSLTPPQRWEFYEDWGMTLNEFLAFVHDGVDAGVIFTHGEPHPGTAEAFELIKGAGHSIHIITDRAFGTNGASEAATRRWLDCHDLPFDSLTFSADKTIVRVDVMIEDKPSNYHALIEAGVDAYLLTRDWNLDVQEANRVSDLLDFAKLVCT